MRFETGSVAVQPKKSALEMLIEIFPSAAPVQIPIHITAATRAGKVSSDKATIRFATSRIVLFETKLPVELEDKVHIENADGSLKVNTVVVAVQYRDNRRAVAAQFLEDIRNWIVQV